METFASSHTLHNVDGQRTLERAVAIDVRYDHDDCSSGMGHNTFTIRGHQAYRGIAPWRRRHDQGNWFSHCNNGATAQGWREGGITTEQSERKSCIFCLWGVRCIFISAPFECTTTSFYPHIWCFPAMFLSPSKGRRYDFAKSSTRLGRWYAGGGEWEWEEEERDTGPFF